MEGGLLGWIKKVAGPQSVTVRSRLPDSSSAQADDEIGIRRSAYSTEFRQAQTFGMAIEMQSNLIESLRPVMEKQISEYRHTYGEVMSQSWEWYNCQTVLVSAIEAHTEIQTKLKAEILKKSKEAMKLFQEFNGKVKYDQLAGYQAGELRMQLAEKVIVALKALQIVNTTPFNELEVDLDEYINTDYLINYFKQEPRRK